MKLGGWGVFLLSKFLDLHYRPLYNDTTAKINKRDFAGMSRSREKPSFEPEEFPLYPIGSYSASPAYEDRRERANSSQPNT